MIKCIVALDKNNGIGAKNDLLFKIKTDLLRFKSLTQGIVVVGYNTLLSFPGSKPLPGRSTICLCPPEIERDDCYCVHTFEDCLKLVEELSKTQDVWIIGGGMLYKSFLDHYDELYITHIAADGEAEVFFPDFTNDFEVKEYNPWEVENGIKYQFVIYKRKLTR